MRISNWEYDPDRINRAITAKFNMRQSCFNCAKKYAPYELPSSVLLKIYSRRKLYNFLKALDYSTGMIQGAFWEFGLAVPRDNKLKQSFKTESDTKPAWLERLNHKESI